MEELKPWVASKAIEETEFQRKHKEKIESEICYGLYSQQQEDSGALSADDKLSETTTPQGGDAASIFQSTIESNTDKPSPIPSDLLMNSALSAVNEINKEECLGEWYNNDTSSTVSQRTYSSQSNKNLLRRETSRSESSLHNDSYSSGASSDSDISKELHSDSAILENHQHHYHHTIQGSASFSHKKSHHQPLIPKKGHSRSKSDQIGIHNSVLMSQIDMELSLPGVSKSLPKEYDMAGMKDFFKNGIII